MDRFKNIIESSLANVFTLADSSKIIGEPLVLDNKIVIPISRVSFAFGYGGSDIISSKEEKKKKDNNFYFENGNEVYPYGGGTLGGVSITPEAFLVISETKSEIINLEKDSSLFETLVDLTQKIIKK